MTLITYLPQDRLRALARGESLPDRTNGSALFADVSGFTPLTDKLTRDLGTRRGIEELARQINVVYDAMIQEIESFGGSVVSFAGDAITCWFDDQDEPAAGRAVAAALAMQTAMSAFTAIEVLGEYTARLAMKTAVASGPARRFLVGDPNIQLLDTLAGQTIERLAPPVLFRHF